MRTQLRAPVSLVITGWLAASSAGATTFCATTSAEFQSALSAAQGNNEHDEIRLRSGAYTAIAGGFKYDSAADESFDVEISGGWSPFFANPCGLQLDDDPWQTVLDGDGQNRILQLFVDAEESDVRVHRLTFIDGFVSPGLGAGLSISYLGDAGGTVEVERNAFIANEATQSSALSVQGATVQKVTNNLFLLNHGGSSSAAYLTTTGLFGVSFTNNTVLNNTHSNSGQPTLRLAAGRAFVANNNFWGNDGYDVEVGNAGDRTLYNNNYESALLHGGEIDVGNISVEPEYQSGLFNFTPVRTSPLVDAGREPEGASPLWYLTELDLNASMRLVGPHVDIGAFENERIFEDGFDPSGPFGF